MSFVWKQIKVLVARHNIDFETISAPDLPFMVWRRASEGPQPDTTIGNIHCMHEGTAENSVIHWMSGDVHLTAFFPTRCMTTFSIGEEMNESVAAGLGGHVYVIDTNKCCYYSLKN